jgi:hypothetical protein
MTIFELLIFAFLSAVLLGFGQFLSRKWGPAGWLVGIVPVALGWIWVLLGAIRSEIADFKQRFASRPVCCQGKCGSRDYVLVSSSAEKTVFRCLCGDLYMRKANRFVHILPDNSEAPYMTLDSSGNWTRTNISKVPG